VFKCTASPEGRTSLLTRTGRTVVNWALLSNVNTSSIRASCCFGHAQTRPFQGARNSEIQPIRILDSEIITWLGSDFDRPPAVAQLGAGRISDSKIITGWAPMNDEKALGEYPARGTVSSNT